MDFLKRFTVTLLSMAVLDFIWLALLANKFYQENIGFLLRLSEGRLAPIWSGAVVVYLAIALGIVFFVVPKARGRWKSAFGWGAIFGAILYGVYDFTNYATLANWPFIVVVVDVLWGMCLCATVSAITAYFDKKA